MDADAGARKSRALDSMVFLIGYNIWQYLKNMALFVLTILSPLDPISPLGFHTPPRNELSMSTQMLYLANIAY